MEIKVFGHRSIVSAVQEKILKIEMAHPMQQNCSN
jgi:hypothetical protein